MRTVTVNASKKYDILIGTDLLIQTGEKIKQLKNIQKVCIVSETTVFPLYGSIVQKSLEDAAFTIVSYVFPAGEESKNAATYLSLLNFLAENKLTRTDLIIALGGGVVGDLAGFAAATYLRGIQFVQIPTSLLAALDSSVGGKTAIDLPAGKNLAGAFCQPSLVLCDLNVLDSLPEEIFRDGCAEAIKYGVLYDPDLFAHLEETGLSFDRETVIARCVEMKGNVVADDEFDTGDRMKLNLGHTIGHGVEARSNFTLSHGKSVAIGMAIVTRAGVKLGFCKEETCRRLLDVLTKFSLPITTDYPIDDIYHYTLSDKKRSGSAIKLIIPNRIGSCDIVPMEVSNLKSFIQAGL